MTKETCQLGQGIKDRKAGTGQSERESKVRTAGTGKGGDKIAETGSTDRTGGKGQLERIVRTGQLCQGDSPDRKDTTGWLEKTGQDS